MRLWCGSRKGVRPTARGGLLGIPPNPPISFDVTLMPLNYSQMFPGPPTLPSESTTSLAKTRRRKRVSRLSNLSKELLQDPAVDGSSWYPYEPGIGKSPGTEHPDLSISWQTRCAMPK